MGMEIQQEPWRTSCPTSYVNRLVPGCWGICFSPPIPEIMSFQMKLSWRTVYSETSLLHGLGKFLQNMWVGISLIKLKLFILITCLSLLLLRSLHPEEFHLIKTDLRFYFSEEPRTLWCFFPSLTSFVTFFCHLQVVRCLSQCIWFPWLFA